ncbi:TPA: glycerol kinase GlpK [Candidatus Poribacteria bacterium]|nr:glycerol kinase GlpK [Candidatus Poribacteria bacterium]
MDYILAVDQGTTGTTVLLVSEEGEIVETAYAELRQIYPRPGWVEHDPEEIWRSTATLIRDLLSQSQIPPSRIRAIGITNQRETAIVWEAKTGKPIHNAIVWQCRRTTDICDQLKEKGLEGGIRDKTGLLLDPYFSATKLAWIIQNIRPEGEISFGTVDSWLIWRMTGGKTHATDQTNASRTMLFNIHRLRWDEELVEIFDVGSVKLPEVLPSSASYGIAQEPSEIRGIPICGVAGDQQASLFGQACFERGEAKNTYGTGCFLMMQTGESPVDSKEGLLTTLACSVTEKPRYALEGSVFIAGAALQWLRDGLGIIESASQSEEMALSVEDTGGVYVVPAFTGLGAPYWDSRARGAILGITRGTGREHIVRATLEAIAHQVADVVEAMERDSGMKISALRVDGGGSANNFLMQFQSDILNMPVERAIHKETTSLGAAYLAGLNVGMWDLDQIRSLRKVDKVFLPQMECRRRIELRKGWRKAVRRVLTECDSGGNTPL